MRRADRLYRLLAFLRRRRQATAQELADHLEVSLRTVYRDVRDLVDSGVPIRGEAGVGYLLERSAELPPVMLDVDEIQALVFGARMVEGTGDPALRAAARSAIDKLAAVLPQSTEAWITRTALFAMPRTLSDHELAAMGELRQAVGARRAVRMTYADQHGAGSERTILPIGLWFWRDHWTLAGWCELRDDYRNFRLDRIAAFEVLDRTFEDTGHLTVDAFVEAMRTRD